MTSTAFHADIARERSTRTARVLTWLQFAYVTWFGVAVWVALDRAAQIAGHLYIPYQGDPHTADVDVFTGWSSIFRTPLMFTATLAPLAFVMAGFSAWQLARPQTRQRALVFRPLLVTTVLVIATFVLAITPVGRQISGWILD